MPAFSSADITSARDRRGGALFPPVFDFATVEELTVEDLAVTAMVGLLL